MIYLLVRLFICPVSSCNRKKSLLIWRAMKWNCGRVYPSPTQKNITRHWDLGPSPPSWGLTPKTAEIRRSNPLSLFMYVMSFTCDLVILMREWCYIQQNKLWFLLRIIHIFIILWKFLDVCLVGGERNICCDILLWDICILAIYCLLVNIYRRQKVWHPTIF